MTLSVVILTKNESKNISKCLQSVAWADEVIIIDDFSTDSTREAAKKTLSSVKIYSRSLSNDFAAQHNFGLEKATGDWIFFVDADETVPPPLRDEVKANLNNASESVMGFSVKRNDSFLGKELVHGETSSWKCVRLARKGAGVWRREVHEYWKISGEVMSLKNPLEHHSHQSVASLIKTLNFYTSIDARHMVETDNLRFEPFRVFANPLGKFFQNFVVRLGFLDGFPGFVMAFMMSFNSLLVRVKIFELDRAVHNPAEGKK